MLKVCINRQTGGGRHGGHHTHFAFTGLPGVEIAALADADPEAVNNFRLTGAERLYAGYREMMTAEKPDIVVLCSRLPDEHYREIKYALQHNCHVLCEKPLADDLPHAYELLALAEEKKLKVQVAHLARFAPAFRELKRMISDGEIGRVQSCYMRGKEDNRGGGEDMIVLGTHIFDAACWIFGLPETVCADVRQNGRLITANDTIAVTEPVGPCAGDEIFARFRFAGGINGFFESRRGLAPKISGERMGITVCGTEGTLTIRYTGNRDLRICRNVPVPVEDDNRYETVEVPEAEDIPGAGPVGYEKLHLDPGRYINVYFAENNRRAAWDLLQAIRDDREPAAGIRSAVHSLEMIVGVYQSSLSGSAAELPLKERRHPLICKEK